MRDEDATVDYSMPIELTDSSERPGQFWVQQSDPGSDLFSVWKGNLKESREGTCNSRPGATTNAMPHEELSGAVSAESPSKKLQMMDRIVKCKRRRPASGLQLKGVWPYFNSQLVPGKIHHMLKMDLECPALMYRSLKPDDLKNQETKCHCVNVTFYQVP